MNRPTRICTLLAVAVASLPIPGQSATCLDFDVPSKTGNIDRDSISESSGLAVSRDHADTLWTHNDSGDEARLFALSSDGDDLGIIRVTGATATDWEAMTIGSCENSFCLYIGDVGDNEARRDEITIWQITEPTPPGADKETIVLGQGLDLVYPDGAMDCEAIAYDPLTGDILLVEKSWTAKARVYRVPANTWVEDMSDPQTLSYIDTIDFDTDSLTGGLVTGADISPSGMRLFARTYMAGFHIPLIRNEQGVITGFEAVVQDEVHTDGQCEAIAFDGTGMELWFTCEDENGPIGKADCLTRQDDDTGITTTEEPGGCQGTAAPWWVILILIYCKMRTSSPTNSRTEILPP